MSLHNPYFFIKTEDNEHFHVFHNCNGALNFKAIEVVDEKTKRLIDMAIEEGKRQKAQEICKALGVSK